MRKLTVAAFVSVDGVMQAPGGADEDRDGGFAYGGWVGPHFDEKGGEAMGETFAEPYDLLLGRKTYDIFAGYWPRFEGKDPIADQFGDANKYIATRDPRFQANWRNSHVLTGDMVEAVRALKAEPGRRLLTQGSADFLQTLLASDLVDAMVVMTFPILLGEGKRLFEGQAQPAGLKLTGSTVTPSGVIVARYDRDGAVPQADIPDPV